MAEKKWHLPPEGQMDKASGIYYQNMTMKELKERREVNDILIVPIGSTETHGPGEPLGEDTPHVCRLCRRAPCIAVCPTEALYQDDKTGGILLRPDDCIGCGMCEEICRVMVRGEPAIRVVPTRRWV